MLNSVKVRKIKNEFQLLHDRVKVASFNSLQKADEMRLLYVGIKPMVSQVFEKSNLPYNLLSRFHHVIKKLKGTDEFVSIIFFRNELARDNYFEVKLNLKGDLFYSRYGELFGYPPLATNDFVERRNEYLKSKLSKGWSQICFHGIQFVCKDANVKECIDWLNQTYVIPTEYQTGIIVSEAFE